MGTPLQTCCGTTLYMAPEILEGKKYHGPTADVWSLGVVLYVFVTGTVPFTGDSPKELIRKVRTGKYSVPSCISKECKNLLKGLLVVNPQGRRSLQKIMDDEWVNLEHTEKLTPYVEEAITRDEKRIEILLRMGYEEEDIEKSLQQQQPDEINATYRLLEETSDENNTTPGVTTEGRQNRYVCNERTTDDRYSVIQNGKIKKYKILPVCKKICFSQDKWKHVIYFPLLKSK
nr:MAP/microtubule affinity-regulating kinase 3-like [Microcebus murinus]